MSDSTPSPKRCTKCGDSFPATTGFFYYKKNTSSHLDTWCKSCRRESSKHYYNHRDEYKALQDTPKVLIPSGESPALSTREIAVRAAAFIDTDGSIMISFNPKQGYYVRCSMSSVTPALLQWMKNHYGGTVRPKDQKHGDAYRRQQTWEWSVTERSTERLLCDIYPFLVIKQEQAKCALELRETKSPFLKKSLEEKLEVGYPYYVRMKELNGKPISDRSDINKKL